MLHWAADSICRSHWKGSLASGDVLPWRACALEVCGLTGAQTLM